MRRPYRVTREARLDLLDIGRYLERTASEEVAEQVLDDLKAGMSRIGRTPGIGHLRPDLTSLEVHFYTVHQYLVIYRKNVKPIEVLRILHGKRDIPAILGN